MASVTWLCVVCRIKVSNPIFYFQEWGKWNVQIEVEYSVGMKQLFNLFCFFFKKQNTRFSTLFSNFYFMVILKIGKCLIIKTPNC